NTARHREVQKNLRVTDKGLKDSLERLNIYVQSAVHIMHGAWCLYRTPQRKLQPSALQNKHLQFAKKHLNTPQPTLSAGNSSSIQLEGNSKYIL
uniref:Transposase Tc1-like domain-containing protein n=1 Tax=Seriola dumerili TaxID=41447 RepID=A0A3B4UUD0_SERDU